MARIRATPIDARFAPPGGAWRLCTHARETRAVYAAVYNYEPDAGHGSHTFGPSDTWRSALLGTVAAGTLLFCYGRRAYAQVVSPPTAPCDDISGTTATCTGNVSSGVSATAPYTVLNVNSLAANITPANNTDGISFTSAGDVTVTTNTGIYSIQATGTGNGIDAHSTGGGTVTVNSTGDISTTNEDGIEATTTGTGNIQVTSIGDVTSTLGLGIYSRTLGGGDVVVNSTGSVSGNLRAISARSAGAGIVSVTSTGALYGRSGGVVADNNSGAVEVTSDGDVTVVFGLAIAGRSETGDVTIDSTGDLTGTASGGGIQARSVSGPGVVTVTSNGDITTIGTYDAIQAGSNSGNINITLNGGTAYGARHGVNFENGAANTLNNAAVLSGGTHAVNGGSANETVNNTGTITGTIDLGGGTNAFNNNAGGTFRSGATVNLGTGNTLTNAGNLSPGNTGTAQVTALTGNLVQTGTGTFTVDINEGAGTPADRVNASGTATFAGTILPNIINITSPTGQVTIATAATLASTATALNVDGRAFSLSVAGGNTLLLSWEAASILNLLTGANANQRAIATYLDTLNASGPSAALQALFDALSNLNQPELLAALNQLLPSLYSDAQIAALYSSLGFSDSLLSCKVNGPDTASIIREGQCLWAGASATFLDSGTTFSQLGFSGTTGSFAAGAQVALDHVWRLGFGAGHQQTTLSSATNATSDGQQGQVGATLKYNPGAFLAAAAISGGRGWYDTTRPVAFTGFSGTATSDSQIGILNGGLRLAYVLGSPRLYFKPVLDAAATRLDLSGFTETGGGAANLSVRGTNQTVYTIAPSLEIGTEWWWPNGTLVRPFLRGGVTWYENADLALSASFVGAPAGVAPFTILNDTDDVMGTVGAGLDVITADDTVLNVTYDGQLGQTTQIHSVALKGSARF